MSNDSTWKEIAKSLSETITHDEIRRRMTESYFDGGVSFLQLVEMGGISPTIPSFLEFSEKYEGMPFRSLSQFGGVEFALNYGEDFEKIGVTGEQLAVCMDGHPDAIRFVCKQILRSMHHANELRALGESHLASRGVVINLTAVKAFVLAALDARERYQEYAIIPDLYFLLSQVLLPGETEAAKAERQGNIRAWALLLGSAYAHKHGGFPSYRRVAKLIGVAPSTISRLFEDYEEFKRKASRTGLSDEQLRNHPMLSAIYPDL